MMRSPDIFDKNYDELVAESGSDDLEQPPASADQPSTDSEAEIPAGGDLSGLAWLLVVMAPIGLILFLLIKSRSAEREDY